MKSYQWSCCHIVDGQIEVIAGLLTPPTDADNRNATLASLNDWFVANQCRPYREVT